MDKRLDTRWKVKILSPQTKNLSREQRGFLSALGDRLRRDNFLVVDTAPSSADANKRYDGMRDADGIIVLAFEQWQGRRRVGDKEEEAILPSEFTHMGIVQAALSKRPYMILREKSVSLRGALRNGFAVPALDIPRKLDPEWLASEKFSADLDGFLKQVRARYHVFLGYSSQASEVANLLSQFLTKELELRVHDWKNFPPGGLVWESIEDAERSTNCGIFLFMEDDAIGNGKKKMLGPRDNVVFEAGFFVGAKRRSRSLVIREKNAKLPSDLDGIVHLELQGRQSIDAIKTKLTDHLQRMLAGED